MSSIFRRVAAVCAISLFLLLKGFAADAAYYLIGADGYVAVLESESGKVYFTEILVAAIVKNNVQSTKNSIQRTNENFTNG